MSIKKIKNIRNVLIAIVILLFLLLTQHNVDDDDVLIYFFDVGQGDATLISLPHDIQILIDGGPDATILTKLGEVMPFYDRTIEYVILSHPHSDHFSGLTHVFEHYEVQHFIHNGVTRDLSYYERFYEAMSSNGSRETVIDSPQTFTLTEDSSMEFIYPDTSLSADTGDYNETSLVHLFQYQEDRVLFTGDISREVEAYLLDKGIDMRATILKVAHQGSRTSSIEAFLRAVNPMFAVVMVGEENQYGHPHPSVLNRLHATIPMVYRTDIDGDVIFKYKSTAFVPR